METIRIDLPRNDVGQLLEGVDVLIDQWEATTEYLRTGEVREDVCIRESHDPHEAETITQIYRDLKRSIADQLV